MAVYSVEVRYRTNAGGNSKVFPEIEADGLSEAVGIAKNRVRTSRGVIKVDGGEAVLVKYVFTVQCLATNEVFSFCNIENAVHHGEKHLFQYQVFQNGLPAPIDKVQAIALKLRPLCG